MSTFLEPLTDLFTKSQELILDFSRIPADTPDSCNIQRFFEAQRAKGLDPTSPMQRQQFHNSMLEATGARYLISQYGEDRSSMLLGSAIQEEGRTIHLGIDIFCRDTENVFAPCDGEIVRIGREAGEHSFGNYLIIKPDDADVFVFFGHLSSKHTGQTRVLAGQKVGQLGDYVNNENGGWSRHLHIQIFSELPAKEDSLVGYCAGTDFQNIRGRYPNPALYWPELSRIVTHE